MASAITATVTADARLSRDGPPLRISDVSVITGFSRPTILRAMDRGDLVGFRIVSSRGSPWLFKTTAVSAWLDSCKFDGAS